MNKNLLMGVIISIVGIFISCSSKTDSFEGARLLMLEQTEMLDSVGTLEQLVAIQVEHGDTIVKLMTLIEPQLSDEQISQLHKLNMNYNQKLRKIADSLVKIQVVDSMRVVK